MHIKFQLQNLKGRDHSEDPIRWKDKLKVDLKKQIMGMWKGFTGLRIQSNKMPL
jgi:hypothetical protein